MEHARDLIQKYLDDVASEAELAELEWLLTFNPQVAAEFARATRIDAFLRKRLGEERGIADMRAALGFPSPAASPADAPGPPPAEAVLPSGGARSRLAWLPWATAAAVLLAVAGTLFVVVRQGSKSGYQVVSGNIRVDGVDGKELHDGARVENLSQAPAELRLPDGSRVFLNPDSAAELHGPADDSRQTVKLLHGAGKFQVEKGAKEFRVDSGAGRVTVLGTEFTVDVQPPSFNLEQQPRPRPSWVLRVEVSEGRVAVRVGDKTEELKAGQKQTFTPDEPFELIGVFEKFERRPGTEWMLFSVVVNKDKGATRTLQLVQDTRRPPEKHLREFRGHLLKVWVDPEHPEQIYYLEAVPEK